MAPPCQKWHERCRDFGCRKHWPAFCSTPRRRDANTTAAGGGGATIFTHKTKRPRLNLSLGTSVDQPSPKCCSIANLSLTPDAVNGSSVPDMAQMGSISQTAESTWLPPFQTSGTNRDSPGCPIRRWPGSVGYRDRHSRGEKLPHLTQAR